MFCLAGPGRDRQVRRLRPRLRGRPLFGIADDLRRDGPLHRRHQPPGHGRPSRPRRCSTRCRSPTPSPTCSAPMGSAIVIAVLGPKLLGINLEAACKDYEAEARRRQQGHGRPRLGLAALGSARVSRGSRRQGRWPARRRSRGAGARRARLHSAHPPQRQDRGSDRGHRAAGRRRRGGRGRARRAGQRPRSERGRGRGSRSCSPCRSKASTSSSRNKAVDGKTLAELAADAGSARRLPAEDHARRDRHRHPDPAEHHGPARRPPHHRRPHAGHQRR